MTVFLVRHGRPLVDRGAPAHFWPLDTAYADEVRALAPDLPDVASWWSSPEPKALQTARLLTGGPVRVVPDLHEHARRTSAWIEEFERVVRAAFAQPDRPAHEGWEPLTRCRDRVVDAVRRILAAAPDGDVVLVGHGTAWTCLLAAVEGRDASPGEWPAVAMPGVVAVAGDVAASLATRGG